MSLGVPSNTYKVLYLHVIIMDIYFKIVLDFDESGI